MRILPITFGIKNQYSTVNTKSFSTPISRNSAPLNYSDIYKTNNNSNIGFSGKYPNQLITNKNELKKLAKNCLLVRRFSAAGVILFKMNFKSLFGYALL